MLPDELLGKFLELINSGTYLAEVGALVLMVTQLLKTLWVALGKPAIEGDAARLLAVAVQVAFWGVYSVLKARGLDGEFVHWSKAIETILSVLFPAIVTGYAVNRSYNVLRRDNTPGFHKSAPRAA